MFGQNDDENQQDLTNDQGQATSSFGMQPPAAPPEPVSQDNTAAFGPAAPAPAPSMPIADDLLSIKQDALQELTPLVGHLEQTPEEKFRTTMMMIQASDDHSLVKEAFVSAKAITDEKARAQALLDVVNEINYFTQHHEK